ncbi:hypothetical protein IMSHALPRED_009155 [Imshaugia aleurites]|uniref:Serine hydrolase domain-containing protein n=1 Tax=Imshaugia aleurites TaxID=172621 RepID=A0A8H3EU51_9LECA|nr:hypothetical protein IMSHALPRED_009155 [Imshaugia aleurites]
MHFLCLHGLGTNSQILELQTAAIRYALGPSHTYTFIEGSLPYTMEPSIAPLVSPGDSFYAYFDPSSAPSILSTLTELTSHIAAAAAANNNNDDEAYDGVIGFSHGSCLAATLLLQAATAHLPLPFKVAVFLSPGMALDPGALERGEVEMFRGTGGASYIGIPTAHVWGENDGAAPGQGERLALLCDGASRSTAVHSRGHSVPGPKEKRDLEAAVRAIKKAVVKAEMGIF